MYSLKGNHSKSVLYFKKVVRMNPFNVTAWTLLGHEYIEMKNSPAAIISYRQALSKQYYYTCIKLLLLYINIAATKIFGTPNTLN